MSLISLTATKAARLANVLRGTPTTAPQYARNFSQNFAHRAVWVRVASGSAGSSSATCSFTYNIYQPGSGELLASGLTPLRPRFPNITYNTPADDSYGVAFKDGSGYRLYDVVQETPQLETCE